MNNKIKGLICTAVLCAALTACGNTNEHDPYVYERQGEMTPVRTYAPKEQKEYSNEGIKEEIIASYSSDDGLCRIDKYPSYYDVTLDLEKGSHRAVGEAYGQTILKFIPDMGEGMEDYIYENIDHAFGGRGEKDYGGIEKRLTSLLNGLPEEYREEIEGFAETVSEGRRGFEKDKKISYEEVLSVQFIADALRPTSCSALSLWGEKTETGSGITLRNLEWTLGSDYQFCAYNAVMHLKNGDKSLTSITLLGAFEMISSINDDGVFAAILDVGSGEAYVYEGKKCYTYELRRALEDFTTAREVGTYMTGLSGDFTFCHNLCITDGKESFQAENCTKEAADAGIGFSNLRDKDTPIMEGLSWDNPDSLCIVNSYITAGNYDGFSGVESNAVRFRKYNDAVKAKEKFTLKDVKELITSEETNQYKVDNMHSNNTAQLIIIDYEKGDIQVAFTGTEGVVNKPDFIDVGDF